MRFLSRKHFLSQLKRHYPKPLDRNSYLWDALDSLKSFGLPVRTSRRRLDSVTLSLGSLVMVRKPLFMFGDHIAGWAGTDNPNRHRPVQVETLDEAVTFLRSHAYFRNSEDFIDNYYLCDQSFSWFVVFCHERDWHLFITHQHAQSPKFVSWAARNKVQRKSA